MMRVLSIMLIVFLLGSGSGIAQSDMMIKGVSPNLHLSHAVAAKETWFSIGRQYNLAPKDIAAANGTSLDKPLAIGQQIKIPLTAANFVQNDSKVQGDVLVPLYHTVQEKEWMYRISVNHNKVPIENLERWNNVTRDEAKAGMKLIVGYLKVKEQSNLATAPVEKKPEPVASTPNKPIEKIQTAEQHIPRETPKTATATEPVQGTSPTVQSTVNFKGGYFKNQFDNAGKSTNGVSGIFKSTSGWNDGKYYALMNNVSTGTIVKVNFPSTNKTIYAKVLGQLPDMKESTGLTIRISDAAANELGAGNSKFTVDVQY